MPDPVDLTPDPSADTNPPISKLAPVGNPAPPPPQAKAPVEEKPKEEAKKEDEQKPDEKADEKSAEKPDEDAPLDHAVWGDAGTDNGNAILSVLQNSGVTVDDAKALLFDAMVAGDVTKIDKAALESKVGKAKATIILTGVKNEIKGRQEAAQAIVAELHTEVGGKENWTKVAEWANKNVPEADLNELRTMIDAGGRQAKLAAKELKSLYEKADGNSSLQHDEKLPGNNPPTQTSAPLSGPQYVRKLAELNTKFNGNPPDNMRQALLKARKEGRARGL
jgi:hypothetical protein